MRGPQLGRLLRGFHIQDLMQCPKRLAMHIPATCAIVTKVLALIATRFAADPLVRRELMACTALTYYMALRANEGAANDPCGTSPTAVTAGFARGLVCHLRCPVSSSHCPRVYGLGGFLE